MSEYLRDKDDPSYMSHIEEFLRTERELNLIYRESESFETMRCLMTLEQELQLTPL